MRYVHGVRQIDTIRRQLRNAGVALVLAAVSFGTVPAVLAGHSFADATLPAPENPHFTNPDVACGGYTNSPTITAVWGAVPGAVAYNYFVYTPAGTQYDTTPWETTVGTNSYDGVFNLGQGTSTFQVQAVASDGSLSPLSDKCAATYDSIAPGISDNFTVSMHTGDKVTLHPSVTDASPLTYQWSVSDPHLLNYDPTQPLNGSSLLIGPAPKGIYTASLTVTDAAGNGTTVSYAITITTPTDNPAANKSLH